MLHDPSRRPATLSVKGPGTIRDSLVVRSTEFAVITRLVDGPQLVGAHYVATLDGEYETALVDGKRPRPAISLGASFLALGLIQVFTTAHHCPTSAVLPAMPRRESR